MSDYLWDRSGAPDPEVERLEELLAVYRAPAEPPVRRASWHGARAAIAALALIGVSMAILRGPAPGAAWEVRQVEGSAQIGGRSAGLRDRLGAGESLRTDAGARVELEVADIGKVTVEPESVLALSGGRADRLKLERGKMTAFIWAPPGRFTVDTPAVKTVDLGCQYTLETQADGSSLVEVTLGLVAFEAQGREAFIPAGAVCRTERGKGPGTPYYKESAVGVPLRRWDAGDGSALGEVLAAAASQDAMTLWHVLRRAPASERGRVWDRYRELVSVPDGVKRESVMAGDAVAMDALWDGLGLGNSSFWREWKRQGP